MYKFSEEQYGLKYPTVIADGKSKLPETCCSCVRDKKVMMLKSMCAEVGIYKWQILRKKERKHAFDQEKRRIHEKKENTLLAKKKGRKPDLDQEKKES